MLSLIRRLFKLDQVRYVIVKRDITRLKPDEWRTNPTLVRLAKKFLDDPQFWMLLDCVRNEHPNKLAFFQSVPLEERALHQARIEGFMMCLNTIEALGTPQREREELQATYEPPDQDMRPEEETV
jgi:hypothetical protein